VFWHGSKHVKKINCLLGRHCIIHCFVVQDIAEVRSKNKEDRPKHKEGGKKERCLQKKTTLLLIVATNL
jgi:hypothetical protein